MILRNWVMLSNQVLVGEIYNDNRNKFEDGTRVRTSKVVEMDFINNIARTINSEYKLENCLYPRESDLD